MSIKSLFHNFHPRKEIEYFVLFKEYFLKLKLLWEKFVRYFCAGFLIVFINISGDTSKLTL